MISDVVCDVMYSRFDVRLVGSRVAHLRFKDSDVSGQVGVCGDDPEHDRNENADY